MIYQTTSNLKTEVVLFSCSRQEKNKGITMSQNVRNEYVRAKGAAQYCSIGVSTIWLYAKQKKITPIKLSPKVTVFNIRELDVLLGVKND